jgi:hypothetical protein
MGQRRGVKKSVLFLREMHKKIETDCTCAPIVLC